MANKTKNKTYGKKRGIDLTAAFESLKLSPPKDTKDREDEGRLALSPISHNAAVKLKVAPSPDTAPSKETFPVAKDPEIAQPKPASPSSNDVDPPPPKRRGRKPKQKATPPPPLSTNAAENHDGAPSNDLPTPNVSLPALQPLLSLPFIEPTFHSFDSSYHTWSQTFQITKVSQGSYASILRLALKSDPSVYTMWKLMPLRPSSGKGSRLEGATSISDAVAEVRLLEAMSRSPGFVEFRGARILQGALPEGLEEVARKWWMGLYREEKLELGEWGEEWGRGYGESQVWLFIEMTDAGCDLERWLTPKRGAGEAERSLFEIWDVFWGIVEALAHGEEHAEFEHRDLHPGNVCVKGGDKKSPDGGLLRKYTDMEVTLIDYTLSRASIRVLSELGEENSEISETEVLANSMRETNLFEQHSDEENDQNQFDTYRYMRDVMHEKHNTAQRKNGWQSYMPMTNVLWLHHILVVLMKATGLFDENWDFTGPYVTPHNGKPILHLDNIRKLIDPVGIWEWECRSATELLSYQVMNQEIKWNWQ
ncbi:uncharacterized protein KY384_002986 [Bacidia gigantensis]|uniref:uncharacterized protein n=1 Tax=Bacidia gigantensis TaxID=2732470 RepID=UPI001D040F84|nr:uncharacterized protein KY384_002986 [Bacidia gigantensis]KAG8531357.1 hypothetical protein KY384_002986 [Bacidia gigantensis]